MRIMKNVSSGEECSASSTPDTSARDGLYLSRYAGDNRGSSAAVTEMFLQ